jgi:fermentation-respiration switch protein FrsA (DUF1100 family)
VTESSFFHKQKLRKIIVGEFTWKSVVRSIVLIYLMAAALAYFFADQIIFQPPSSAYNHDKGVIKIGVGDKHSIAAVHLPNDLAPLTILYSHSTGEDLGSLRNFLGDLRDHGFAIFAFDYRGYGASTGWPSERNSCEDIESAYAYMVEKLKIPPESIVVYGTSLGSGPATYLASRNKVAGLILEGAFVSAFRVRTVIPIFPFDKFPNINRISQVKCPVLVMHSKDDEVVPFWHGEALFERAAEPKLNYWPDNAGHLGIPWSGDGYWHALRDFSETILARPGQGTAPSKHSPHQTSS